MSNRNNVLKYIIDNGPSTRTAAIEFIMEATGAGDHPLRQAFYQLVKGGWLEQHGETTDPATTYSITESGVQYYEDNKNKARRPYPKRRAKPPAVGVAQESAFEPNISPSATTLVDQISTVLKENADLRDALVKIRSTINELLGDNEIIHFGETTDGIKEHSHSD